MQGDSNVKSHRMVRVTYSSILVQDGEDLLRNAQQKLGKWYEMVGWLIGCHAGGIVVAGSIENAHDANGDFSPDLAGCTEVLAIPKGSIFKIEELIVARTLAEVEGGRIEMPKDL